LFRIIDIGARNGFSGEFQALRSVAEFIGFEADVAECNRLNDTYASDDTSIARVFPVAIGGRAERRAFYRTRLPHSAGLYRPNQDWWSRFPAPTLDVLEERMIDTVTLDQFCVDHAIGPVDVLHVDVEGAEYDVIDAAPATLDSVLAIKTEVWWSPKFRGQRSFADLDTLIRGRGFEFYDLDLHRYARNGLPLGRLTYVDEDEGRVRGFRPEFDVKYGQACTGDALYFRDPVGELRAGALHPRWTAHSLLKLCALFDVFDYADSAVEILDTFAGTLLAGLNLDRLYDALVPVSGGQATPYGVYGELSTTLMRDWMAQRLLGFQWQPPPTKYRGS
jgi:FkbM family methyltransferase